MLDASQWVRSVTCSDALYSFQYSTLASSHCWEKRHWNIETLLDTEHEVHAVRVTLRCSLALSSYGWPWVATESHTPLMATIHSRVSSAMSREASSPLPQLTLCSSALQRFGHHLEGGGAIPKGGGGTQYGQSGVWQFEHVQMCRSHVAAHVSTVSTVGTLQAILR
jgi:hypothetical protein